MTPVSEARDADIAFYRIHEKVGIGVRGRQNPIAEVIGKELQSFRSPSGPSDLTIVLGGVPSADWKPRGVPVGANLLCDTAANEVVVLRTSKPVYSRGNVRYVIRGDTRSSTGPVSVYVPNLEIGAPRWERVARMFLRDDFLSNAESIADEILTGLVEPFLYYALPNHGCSLVHASAVSLSNGSGIMFLGTSNLGKTTMALHMVNGGCGFVGDDLVIVSKNGRILSYPKRIKLEAQHLALFAGFAQRIGSTMSPAKRMLFAGFTRSSSDKPFEMAFYHPPISEIFGNARIVDQCDLQAVVRLGRSATRDFSLREIGMESCLATLKTDLFWEFDTPSYRFNQYRYCLTYASQGDVLEHELKHHNAVGRVLATAMSTARAFELFLPLEPEAGQVQGVIGELLSRLVR